MVEQTTIPAEVLREVDGHLVQVLSLFSVLQECASDAGNEKLDKENMLCNTSRTVALTLLGGEKVRQIIRSLEAYT